MELPGKDKRLCLSIISYNQYVILELYHSTSQLGVHRLPALKTIEFNAKITNWLGYIF